MCPEDNDSGNSCLTRPDQRHVHKLCSQGTHEAASLTSEESVGSFKQSWPACQRQQKQSQEKVGTKKLSASKPSSTGALAQKQLENGKNLAQKDACYNPHAQYQTVGTLPCLWLRGACSDWDCSVLLAFSSSLDCLPASAVGVELSFPLLPMS